MDIKDFSELIKSQSRDLDKLMRRQLPIKVGRMAKDHYQENFRQGGFVNRGLQKWPATRRQQSGATSAAASYGPLLSGRNHLFSSIKYMPGDYRVTVSNDLPYAAIHNQGGTISTTVTPKMRRFAWYMYYNTSERPPKGQKGKKKSSAQSASPQAEFWRNLALTRKQKLTVKIPKRQFIGKSEELTKSINEKIEQEIINILGL
ncbi:phage virion morphogenesis protein [Prevotella melaninogenica]|uniref:Phage virion morphogenesis protein n=1 Tax=Prevotella melaninogenica TaxID=28132 RepID=A0ABS6YAX5_9BACT|nr:phage virion morphogenesis protein [Prevotella melaninogenica]MBW4755811.1 phage virion morphogenesis protein [Prevotella melaninogenica]